MKQSCLFQNLHVMKQFYSFSYLYVLILINQKTFSVRSHVRSHVRSDVTSHVRRQTKEYKTHSSLHAILIKMKCLHGELCAQSTTQNGSFWFCNQSPSCNFFCSKDESYLYEKAAAVWKSTKQPHPRCEKHGKLAKMYVVKNLLKSNNGRPFFVCSDQSNPCSFRVCMGRCTTRSKAKMASWISVRNSLSQKRNYQQISLILLLCSK